MTTTETFQALAERLGFTLEFYGPSAQLHGKEKWQCISFHCRLHRNGILVLETPFRFGVGHVKLPQGDAFRLGIGLTDNEKGVLNTLQRKPYAEFKDSTAPLSLYQKLAVRQKLAPTVTNVLSSCIQDGAPYFDHETFSEWANNLGFNDDSITDKLTYDTCCEIGARLTRCLSAAELDELREAARDL